MSKDQKRFEPKTYYHLKLKTKDWCFFKGDCPMEENIGDNYCWICKYKKELDVPDLLKERGRK